MRPVINTEKHYVQTSLSSVATGAILPISLAFASAGSPTAVEGVREGAVVKAVYIEMWILSEDAVIGTVIATLEKRSGNMVAMTAAQSAGLGVYVNKKNIFHTFMGIVGDNNQYPMAVIKGWFKIPKGKQRFGLQDLLVLNIHAQTNPIEICGFCTYKEQY